MDILTPLNVLSIFACVSLAALMQSLSGFGFGLVVVSSFTLFNLMPLTLTTVFVSVLGLINSVGLVKRNLPHVKWSACKYILISGLPFVVIGFALLELLSTNLSIILNLLLGVCILVCCCIMGISASSLSKESNKFTMGITGAMGGLLGGMFSTFGPPVVYMCYRQPWSIPQIRSTLLAIFSVTAIFRITLAGFGTVPPKELGILILLSLPIVVMMTALGHRVSNKVPTSLVRPIAIGLLSLSGISIIITNVTAF